MDERLNRLFEPHMKLVLVILFLFSALMLWKQPVLGIAEFIITVLLMIFFLVTRHRRKAAVSEALSETVRELVRTGKSTLLDSPFPMVVFRPESGEVVWSNDRFLEVTGRKEHLSDARIKTAVPDFDSQWLMDGKQCAPVEYPVHGRRYMVFGGLSGCAEDGESVLATTYWIDITGLANTRELYYATRPIVGIITIDNYEELTRNLLDSDRSNIRASIEKELNRWLENTTGMLCRYDRDRYLLMLEEQHLEALKKCKFCILDNVHEVVSPNGISASLSIGFGRDGSFAEMFRFAALSVEMALSRGGDQAVIKNQFSFEFFGGRSREQERRTKVKSRVMANALEKLITSSSQVYVMGHRYADLDAVGSAAGVCAIARKKGVPVHLIREDKEVPGTILIRQLETHEEYGNVFLYADEALSRMEPDTLLVVVDTNRPDQVASLPLLQASNKIAVIDHHRRAADYIDNAVLNYHEPYASSASELVTELIQYIIDPGDLSRAEAEGLLAGIVLDTKSFTLRTGGRTFEAAAFLRRCGADTAEVRKLFQNDLDETVMRYEVMKNAKFYHKGVAVAASTLPIGRIIAAQAADELLNVSGVTASFVLYEEEGTVFISGRSSTSVNVQLILEELGGGGNGAAAGAQLRGSTVSVAAIRLENAIEHYFKALEN